MDAIAILWAHRDLETLFFVMIGYLLPLSVYCITSVLAFLALCRRGDGAGRTMVEGLLVLALPIAGAVLVLARSSAPEVSSSR